MAKFEYTPEMVADLANKYTARRDNGERNAVILRDLAEDYEGLTVRSLRAKLMIEKVYVKDTEAEKAENAKDPKPAKERRTKSMVAVSILTDLGLNVKMADDLAKAKADTLEAIFAAVREITKEPEAAEEVAEEVAEG